MARDFLGIDTKFPIQGKFKRVDRIDVVLQDIQILIGTVPGERVMRPEYGCRLYTRLWDSVEEVAREGVTDIRDAIREFEPRVDLLSVTASVSRSTGLIKFAVSFRLKNTNTAANLVFPFEPRVSNS
jgi:phage baseplate assembly protein W